MYGVVGRVVGSFVPFVVCGGLVVCCGRVVYCGGRGFVERFAETYGIEVYDYSGYTVLPGFIDAHLHLDGVAVEDEVIDLLGCRSIGEVLYRVRRFLARGYRWEWVLGRGWDQELFVDGRMLTGRDLDELGLDKPVLLTRVCGHVAAANKQALQYLSSSKDVDWEKGVVYGDRVGELWSIGVDSIVETKGFHGAILKLASKGVTGYTWVSARLKHLLLYWSTPGPKPLTRVMLEPGSFREWISYKLHMGAMGVIGVKIVLDGSLGTWTASLTEPYSDKPGETGKLYHSPGELSKLVSLALENKYHVAVHAIGDKALDILLKTYMEHGAVGERIEHASLVRDDQLQAIAELKPRIALQPGFILSDKWLHERLGEKRIKWAYRINTLSKTTTIGYSSDAPVEPPDPWRNIYAAVTRGEYEGLEISSTREEKVELINALHHHTAGAAETMYVGDAGRLLPGYRADYIVVDKNPLETSDPRELLNIRVLETWIEGLRIYKA